MREKTLEILRQVEKGDLSPKLAQHQLFVLFGISERNCMNCAAFDGMGQKCNVNPQGTTTILNPKDYLCNSWRSRYNRQRYAR